jgi:hypothetical protein
MFGSYQEFVKNNKIYLHCNYYLEQNLQKGIFISIKSKQLNQ